MRGYLLTENAASRWGGLARAVQPRMLLTHASVGILAGLLMAHVRLHLGLSGHKALLWMTPVLLARLLSPCPIGGTVGACVAACASLAVGGHIAGGILFLPLVAVAGVVLDLAVAFADRRQLAAYWLVPLMGLAGMAANLVCCFKRLLVPLRAPHLVLGLSGGWACLVSYAVFGLLAGLTAAALAILARRVQAAARPRHAPGPR